MLRIAARRGLTQSRGGVLQCLRSVASLGQHTMCGRGGGIACAIHVQGGLSTGACGLQWRANGRVCREVTYGQYRPLSSHHQQQQDRGDTGGHTPGRSSHSREHDLPEPEPGEEIQLLKAKFIGPLRLAIRSKHANLVLMTLVLCDQTIRLAQGTPILTSPLAWTGIGVATALTLVMARFATRIILRMSFHPDTGQIRVSTLNYYARRQDYLVNAEDIIPYVDASTRQKTSALLHKLALYNNNRRRYYCLKYSNILDQEILSELLWLPPELGGVEHRTWTQAQKAADDKAQRAEEDLKSTPTS